MEKVKKMKRNRCVAIKKNCLSGKSLNDSSIYFSMSLFCSVLTILTLRNANCPLSFDLCINCEQALCTCATHLTHFSSSLSAKLRLIKMHKGM